MAQAFRPRIDQLHALQVPTHDPSKQTQCQTESCNNGTYLPLKLPTIPPKKKRRYFWPRIKSTVLQPSDQQRVAGPRKILHSVSNRSSTIPPKRHAEVSDSNAHIPTATSDNANGRATGTKINEVPTTVSVPSASPAAAVHSGVTEDLERVDKKDKERLYSLDGDVFVGFLLQVPPPAMVQAEWQVQRLKLIEDLRPAIELISRQARGQSALIEPWLCMTGRADAGTGEVHMRPTIWIRCGSKACRNIIQKAVDKRSELQDFAPGGVQVQLHAPRFAGRLQLSLGGIHANHSLSISDEQSHRSSTDNSFPVLVFLPNMPFSSPYGHSACGNKVKYFSTQSGSERKCVIGGIITVDGVMYGLTTAHALKDELFQDSDSTISGVINQAETSYNVDTQAAIGQQPHSIVAGITSPGAFTWQSATVSHIVYAGTTVADLVKHPKRKLGGSDFALVSMESNTRYLLNNFYCVQPSQQDEDESGIRVINSIANDVKPGTVSILCSQNDVREGYLLPGEDLFLEGLNVFKTRKIQTKSPLETGISGTWVVRGSTLLGMIVAIYSEEPYVHMLPITDVFSDIEALLTKNDRRPKVDLYIPTSETQMIGRIATEQGDVITALPSEMPTEGVKAQAEYEDKESAAPATLAPNPLARNQDWYYQIGSHVALYLTLFTLGLDAGAFSTIVPTIIDDFKSLSHIGWYGEAYAIAYCAFFSAMMVMSRVVSAKFGYLFSMLVFEIGCILCIFARSSDLVITSRTLSGMGAGGCAAMIVRLVLSDIPQVLERRSMLLLLYPQSYAIGRFVGPIVGGGFVDKSIWHRSFYLSTSIGGCAFLLGLVCLPPTLSVRVRSRAQNNGILAEAKPVDYHVILASGCLVCLALGLHFGSLGSWSSGKTIGTFVASAFCFLTLLPSLWARKTAILSISSINVWISATFSFVWGASFNTWHLYFPLLLQFTVGENPIRSGIFYLPTTGLIFLLPLLSWLLTIYQRKPLLRVMDEGGSKTVVRTLGNLAALISLVLMAIGSGLSSTIDSHTTLAKLIGYETIFSLGAGFGACVGIISASVAIDYGIDTWSSIATDPKERLIFAASLVLLSEQFGAAISIPAAQTVFMTLLKRHGLVELVNGSGVSFTQMMRGEQFAANPDGFNTALTRVFFVCTGAAAGCCICYLARPMHLPKPSGFEVTWTLGGRFWRR